ncbi:hypothetical protein [Parathalassolituus penaei]|uniref:Uncharacterized protein n=1 Tax=Parathalassolituus penaei TaxID=2997323 RepID=A0A9X3EF24_9GAMM|nr:hypothetical protein [Parathalassolituus penaei]MCY0966357.1 hypothetical protein [Parathalassolituus penaei]
MPPQTVNPIFSILMNKAPIFIGAISIATLAFYFQIDAFDLGIWTLDYSQGFIKRGLAGSIMSGALDTPYTIDSLRTAFASIYLILAIVLFQFLRSSTITPLLALTFFSSGFMIQQIGYTSAKLDGILLTITVCGLTLISHTSVSKSLAGIIALIIPALLIHEAAALLVVPILVIAMHIKETQLRTPPIHALVLLTVSVITFFTILSINSTSAISQSELIQSSQAKIGSLTADNNAFLVNKLSVTDNINWAITRLLAPETPSRIMLNLIAGLPFITILTAFYHQLKSKVRYLGLSLFVVIGASAFMYILGIDFSRWNAWILTNTTLLILFSAQITKKNLQPPRGTVILSWIFLLWSGPFGVTVALPQRGSLIYAIANIF